MADTKNCPFCGEEILAVAIKCKHCKSHLTAEATNFKEKGTIQETEGPQPQTRALDKLRTQYKNVSAKVSIGAALAVLIVLFGYFLNTFGGVEDVSNATDPNAGCRDLRDEFVADILRASAEAGDACAQHNLGRAYANGNGVAQDVAEAVRWYRLAAENGLAEAQFALGRAYANNGNGVAQDVAEAVRWIRLAADQGYAAAQFALGRAYANGNGVAQDDAEAVRWYRLAAENGLAEAQAAVDAVNASAAQERQAAPRAPVQRAMCLQGQPTRPGAKITSIRALPNQRWEVSWDYRNPFGGGGFTGISNVSCNTIEVGYHRFQCYPC